MKQIFAFCLFLFIISCSRDQVAPSRGSATFSMSQVSRSLKGGRMSSLTASASVLLSIEDNSDKAIFQNKRLTLFAFGQGYESESLELIEGTYKLTQFQILDANDTIIYASPLAGSNLAQYVTNPLPLSFTVTKGASVEVVPQVLAVTSTDTPDNFGYASFGFQVVGNLRLKQTFQFYGNLYSDTLNYYYTGDKLTSVVSADRELTEKYYYDNSGKLSKIERYQSLSLTETLIYQYNSQGQLTSIQSNFRTKSFFYDSSGLISMVHVVPGQLSDDEKMYFLYDADHNPSGITITGRDSNGKIVLESDEAYSFDSNKPVTGDTPTELFLGLTYELATMNHLDGFALKHNIYELVTQTTWTSGVLSHGLVKSDYEYNSLGYPIKETIHNPSAQVYFPVDGTVKYYVYE